MSSLNSYSLRLRAGFLGLVAVAASLAGPWLSAAESPNIEPDIKLYLEIKGIAGDVTDPGFEQQIEVIAYSWAPANFAADGSDQGEAGEITLLKYIDSSSPALSLIVAAGYRLKAATLTTVRTAANGVITSITIVELRDVTITGVQTDDVLETITFNFGRSKVTNKTPGGKVSHRGLRRNQSKSHGLRQTDDRMNRIYWMDSV